MAVFFLPCSFAFQEVFMLARICSACGKLVPQGGKCPCRANRHAEYDHACRNKEKAAFYGSASWKRISDAARKRAGFTDEYVRWKTGMLMPGSVVHHIRTIDERPDLALDLDNLVCVSSRTHSMIHDAYKSDKKKEMQGELLALRGCFVPGI